MGNLLSVPGDSSEPVREEETQPIISTTVGGPSGFRPPARAAATRPVALAPDQLLSEEIFEGPYYWDIQAQAPPPVVYKSESVAAVAPTMPETPKISPLSSEGIDPKMLVDMMVRARNGDESAVAYCNAFLKNAPSSRAEEDRKRPVRDEVVDIASDEDDDDDDDYDLTKRIKRDKKAR